MSLTYGFYNSLNGDRKYNASQMSRMFDGLIYDGVFASVGSALLVSATTGMVVKVGSGRAWFNRTWTYNDSDMLLQIEQSEVAFHRIDAVVLEVNESLNSRTNNIKVIKGVPSLTPSNPVLVNTSEIHQYPLAYIYVAAGVTSIVGGNITNKIGTVDCPFVTGVMSTITTDALVAQWQAQFQAWFDTLGDILDANAAGNLLNMINTTNSNVATLTTNVNNADTDLFNKTIGARLYAYKNMGGTF